MGFSRQEHWSGLPFPFPGNLPDPGIEPGSPTDSSMSELPGKSKAVLFSKWEGEMFILHVTWTPYGPHMEPVFIPGETRAWLCLDSTNLAVWHIPIEHQGLELVIALPLIQAGGMFFILGFLMTLGVFMPRPCYRLLSGFPGIGKVLFWCCLWIFTLSPLADKLVYSDAKCV